MTEESPCAQLPGVVGVLGLSDGLLPSPPDRKKGGARTWAWGGAEASFSLRFVWMRMGEAFLEPQLAGWGVTESGELSTEVHASSYML